MIRYVLPVLLSWSAFAQTGTLNGRVVDSQGRAIADATVRLLRQADSSRTETDSKGAFAFERLAAGEVVLEIEKPQFRRESRIIQFKPGSAAEEVTLEVEGVNQ